MTLSDLESLLKSPDDHLLLCVDLFFILSLSPCLSVWLGHFQQETEVSRWFWMSLSHSRSPPLWVPINIHYSLMSEKKKWLAAEMEIFMEQHKCHEENLSTTSWLHAFTQCWAPSSDSKTATNLVLRHFTSMWEKMTDFSLLERRTVLLLLALVIGGLWKWRISKTGVFGGSSESTPSKCFPDVKSDVLNLCRFYQMLIFTCCFSY